MTDAPHTRTTPDSALQPLAPGELIRIGNDMLTVDIAPAAGGRIAQITHDGREWLVGHDDAHAAMIAWGCYPMLPWAGRIRHGRFQFGGRDYSLPPNLGEHAIHGVGFGMPWQVERHSSLCVELALQLPHDTRWPFGGMAHHRIEVEAPERLKMQLRLTAGENAMPVTIGWHPWFRKPDRFQFSPDRVYPRDAEGIATLPLGAPPPQPWDDSFINDTPIHLHRGGRMLQLTSSCNHWVVFDAPAHATCVEPQSGPPDAFNIAPVRLQDGQSCTAWYVLEWS